MSHTPGPWCVRDIPSKERYVGPSRDGGAPSVAIIPARLSRSDAEQAANARLVAAAPDLLSALQEVSQALTIENAIRPDYGWAAFVAEVVTPAIKRATGEQP